ncbi:MULTISPECIES: GntR family transcriptional regulator [unclassified Amycolatopsis]|uniref:GntR family transcriptional regulator n=1 Tax=unclassified Amycolatopsis TaxID=2618356 RepID=UPI001C69AF18|nr:GntR family transcriptional regulator [Amycolatopsis sp. DSM 110486]QYN21603.1 GntR family transcriptional regulator [Amycolatopsis sp. DSM 110486]
MKQARMDPRTKRRLSAARRVRDLLRAAIVHEEFPAGALPGEAELMLSFSASRQVIRDALALLREEGLVKRVQGTGTFSVASKVRHAFSHLHGPEPALERVSHQILAIAQEVAAPRVADRLGLPVGAECGVIEYLAVLGTEPYYACTAYVPLPLLGVVRHGRTVTEWYSVYEAAGFELGVTDQAVEAIVADDEAGAVLDVPAGAPLMLFERLVRDRSGRPLEYAFARVRGDRIALLAQLPRHRRQRRLPQAAQEA